MVRLRMLTTRVQVPVALALLEAPHDPREGLERRLRLVQVAPLRLIAARSSYVTSSQTQVFDLAETPYARNTV